MINEAETEVENLVTLPLGRSRYKYGK